MVSRDKMAQRPAADRLVLLLRRMVEKGGELLVEWGLERAQGPLPRCLPTDDRSLPPSGLRQACGSPP